MLENIREALGKAGLEKVAKALPHVPSLPTRWVERIAMAGLYAKGLVYCLIGGLALKAVFELGNPTQSVNRRHVFLFIEELLLGRVLLGLVAGGLACYCAWRLLQAIQDTEHRGTGAKGLAYRLRYAVSGMFYGLLALLAAKLAAGDGDGGGLRQAFVEGAAQRPIGQVLLFLAAAALALAGAYQAFQGVSGRYRKKIKEKGWKDDAEETLIQAGRVGYVARGTVWGIIAYLLARVALQIGTDQAGAAANPFLFLENASSGPFLLGGVALGLICYGLFIFMQAKFRKSGP